MANTEQNEASEQPPTFKEQLDKAAIEQRNNDIKNNQPPNPIVEKITEYVPAAAKLLGTEKKEEDNKDNQAEIPGPPNRPDHDPKIEEFVRDQHRSKAEDSDKIQT